MQKSTILLSLIILNILFTYYLLNDKIHPYLRALQQIIPVNPFQTGQNATKPGPIVQSSGSQTEAISVLDLINQLQNDNNENSEFDFGEDYYELENLKSYGWGIIDYFSHFENTEVSSDFGATSSLSSDEKTCNIDLLSQGTVAYSGTLNAHNVNITAISLNDDNGKIDSIKYSGNFCQCWVILWEGYNMTGASWGFMLNYDKTVDDIEDDGQISLEGLTNTNSQCQEISADSSISSYEFHCYNF